MAEAWPALPLDEWRDTYETLHRWTQVIGKVRLVQLPWINHAWHCTLYVTARGLTTGPVPHGDTSFQVNFDFLEADLRQHLDDFFDHILNVGPRPQTERPRTLDDATAKWKPVS